MVLFIHVVRDFFQYVLVDLPTKYEVSTKVSCVAGKLFAPRLVCDVLQPKSSRAFILKDSEKDSQFFRV